MKLYKREKYGRRFGLAQPRATFPAPKTDMIVWNTIILKSPYFGALKSLSILLEGEGAVGSDPSSVLALKRFYNYSRSGSQIRYNKQTSWPESASDLYRKSDHRLSATLVSTFADRWCHVVRVTDPYGSILGFLDRSRYFFFQAALQLYSRG
jgi:hypothetical protein